MRIRYCATSFVLGALSLGIGHARAQHTGDVWIARTATGHQLAIDTRGFVPDDNYAVLVPASGLFSGWTDNDPGFDHITEPSPNGVFLPIQSGAQVWLEMTAVDPAFSLWTTGFQQIDTPGEAAELGGSGVHVHWTWHINDQDPGFDPGQCVWHATFLLRDEGSTNYQDSAPFTFAFTNVPLRDADGDFDENGFVDGFDLEAYYVCLDGPGLIPQPADPAITTCEVECLNAFDFDEDRDVDLEDFLEMQQRLVE